MPHARAERLAFPLNGSVAIVLTFLPNRTVPFGRKVKTLKILPRPTPP
jgi:hypothetical protein